jgi:hypothetical protein
MSHSSIDDLDPTEKMDLAEDEDMDEAGMHELGGADDEDSDLGSNAVPKALDDVPEASATDLAAIEAAEIGELEAEEDGLTALEKAEKKKLEEDAEESVEEDEDEENPTANSDSFDDVDDV